VVFNPEQAGNFQDVIEAHGNRDTTLTGWLKANVADGSTTHDLLYQDFPSRMMWSKKTYKWTPRRDGFAIGRMYHTHPTSGECFYLRLLLTCVKGTKSFNDLYSFKGTQYPSFREA
jgi:hypothetical protein